MSSTSTFICSKCDKAFTKKCNLIRHIKICNIKTINFNKNHIICPVCSECFFRSSTLDEHLEKKHEINITCEEKVFSSDDDFHKWKDEVEKSSKSSYRKASVNNKSSFIIYFRCHRSGFFSSTSTGKRKSKNRGSCKIGGYCPSRIIVRKLPHQTNIRYYPTHVGHDKEIQFLHLSREVEETIAHKLKQGESLDTILNNRDEFIKISNSEEEIQLINRKKLYNIIKKYNIPYAGNYCDTRTEANLSVDKTHFNKQTRRRKFNEELCIEEATVVMTEIDLKNAFAKDGVYLSSSDDYDPESNLFIREEIRTISNDLNGCNPDFETSISDKLRQVRDLVDETDLKTLCDDDQNKIMSNIDEIVQILTNSCTR